MASADEKELLKITGYHDRNFYNIIFGIQNHNISRFKELQRILYTNKKFIRKTLSAQLYDFASAATDFSRKMVIKYQVLDDDVNCKNFCCYFEFVISEFDNILLKIKKNNISQNPILHLKDQYFSGLLLKKSTKEITDNALNDIKKLYDDYAKDVEKAVKKLTTSMRISPRKFNFTIKYEKWLSIIKLYLVLRC